MRTMNQGTLYGACAAAVMAGGLGAAVLSAMALLLHHAVRVRMLPPEQAMMLVGVSALLWGMAFVCTGALIRIARIRHRAGDRMTAGQVIECVAAFAMVASAGPLLASLSLPATDVATGPYRWLAACRLASVIACACLSVLLWAKVIAARRAEKATR